MNWSKDYEFDLVLYEIEAEILSLQLSLLIERHSICADEEEQIKIEDVMKEAAQELTNCYKLIASRLWDEILRKGSDPSRNLPLETNET